MTIKKYRLLPNALASIVMYAKMLIILFSEESKTGMRQEVI
jgi:hypothetical protein